MNSHQSESEQLQFIKQYLLNQRGIDDDDQELIENAESAGEISCMLFSNDLFHVYYLLNDHVIKTYGTSGMMPTEDELNKIREPGNTNAWYGLLQSNHEKADFILSTLFKSQKYPDIGILLKCTSYNNQSILDLIESKKEIIPTHIYTEIQNQFPIIRMKEILNTKQFTLTELKELDIHLWNTLIHAKSINEIWHIIFSNDLLHLYRTFTSQNVYPTADSMNQSQSYSYINGWHWLLAN